MILDNMEYIDGFTNEDLDSLQFSVNTFIDYTHYALSLPNDDLKWTISGNYILVVYEELDGETFSVNFKNVNLEDPLTNISACVLQNFRWDNAIMGLQPKFINGDNLVFDYSDEIIFPALKEYRSFDTRS